MFVVPLGGVALIAKHKKCFAGAFVGLPQNPTKGGLANHVAMCTFTNLFFTTCAMTSKVPTNDLAFWVLVFVCTGSGTR